MYTVGVALVKAYRSLNSRLTSRSLVFNHLQSNVVASWLSQVHVCGMPSFAHRASTLCLAVSGGPTCGAASVRCRRWSLATIAQALSIHACDVESRKYLIGCCLHSLQSVRGVSVHLFDFGDGVVCYDVLANAVAVPFVVCSKAKSQSVTFSPSFCERREHYTVFRLCCCSLAVVESGFTVPATHSGFLFCLCTLCDVFSVTAGPERAAFTSTFSPPLHPRLCYCRHRV